MAQKTVIHLIDDIDGGTATQTVTFALDGVSYEIDLSDEHAGSLREQLGAWTSHARKSASRAAVGRPVVTSKRTRSAQSADVRHWAEANGLRVSTRGRIPAEVREAYDRAHN